MTIPNKNGSGGSHLPDECADLCGAALQQPLNPHRQKLLAAANRAAKVEKPAGGPKAKAKAKAKAKNPKAEAVPKVKAAEVKEKAKTDYQNAKNAFLEKLLDNIQNHIISIISTRFSFVPSTPHSRNSFQPIYPVKTLISISA